ncbi:MAG: TonB-dependent receptor, partial [Acidobacteriota bacterium]|nr:TonB-dependent receptor [Acidobacteriota bacterium]
MTDQSGAIVDGAAVTVTNPQTGFTRQVLTNNAGNYVFPALLPGLYDVKVSKQGFAVVSRNGVELQVNQVARLDFQMQVGGVAEQVEVTAGAPLLATENATVGTVIENRRIVELPLNGRNYLQLVALSPNVNASFASAGQAGSRQGGDRSSQQLSIAGNRREWNYFTLDGVDNTDVNFNTYIFMPSIDALQEFKVETGIYSAEFGREAGQVNVSSKPGTNEYHGTVFEFLRNSTLDARPYAFTSNAPAKAPFRWNQYGFTLGGPVWIPKLFNGRNRLFFMSNFEGFRLRNQSQGVYSLPTAAMQTGDFSGILPNVIRDPLNNQPFPNNIIPTTRLDPVAKKLLEFYPAANIPGAGLVNNYLALDNNVTNKDQFTQRIDFVESSKSNWFGRYSWDDELAISPALKLNGTNLQTHVGQAMIDNTRVLKPTLVNEFRFGYNHFFNSFGRELAFQRDVVKELNLPGLNDPPPPAWGIPAVGILGFSGFGDDSEGPYVNYNHTFQWTDNVSWTHGAHSFKFGGEIRRDRYNQLGNQFARGSFIIENQATGYGFADFMLGYTRRDEDSAALAITQFRATSQAYYAADTWKVRPNLTIDLGIRYEYVPPWSDRGDSLMNAWVPANIRAIHVTDPNLQPALVRIGSGDVYANTRLRFNPALNVVRDGRLGDRLINSDPKDFAPRLGIAWSPGARWTVRTGFGVFFSQDTSNPVFDMGRNLSGRVRVESNTQTHDLTFANPFGAGGGTSACGVPTPPYVCISQPYVLGNNYDRSTPYVMQYEINLQHQFSESTVVEAGYLGSQGHRLIRMYAFNEALPGATGSVTDRTPFPQFGRIQEIGNSSDSNYNSFSLKLTRRFSSGLTYLAGYTFSRS